MSTRSNSYKHYPHIFTPMQMLYNYTNNIKSTIVEFFRQYLKPEGRQILLLFNRYMVMAIFINIDLTLLLALSVVVYIVIKLLKVRPWKKERHANVPLNYVDALYDLRRRSSTKDQQRKSQKDIQEACSPSISQKSNSFNENARMPIFCVHQKQQMLRQVNEPEIGHFTASQIEHYIYNAINSVIQGYCRVVWYLKWSPIGVLWLITGFIYMFEPSNQYDTFKLKTKKDGALIIGEVKKASQIINYFQLIFICLLANTILFYYYGTRQLKNELLLEVYTREYTISMVKNRRLRATKSSLNAEKRQLPNKPLSESPGSPLLFFTVVDRSKPVDLKQLKNFGLSSQQKQSPKIEAPEDLSERKFSHDVPTMFDETPHQKSMNSQNKEIEQMLERSMVQLEEEYQYVEPKNPALLNHLIQHENPQRYRKDMNISQNSEKGEQIEAMDTLITHKDAKKSPKLQKDVTFLSTNSSQSLLASKNRKASDEYKTHQVYNNFKISLFKVQQISAQSHANSKKSNQK